MCITQQWRVADGTGSELMAARTGCYTVLVLHSFAARQGRARARFLIQVPFVSFDLGRVVMGTIVIWRLLRSARGYFERFRLRECVVG